YIRAKSLSINIKLAINIEGVLNQTQNLNHTITLLHRFNFDFNFIDIERNDVRAMVHKYSNRFDNISNYQDYYEIFIAMSKLKPSKCVYTKITKNYFKILLKVYLTKRKTSIIQLHFYIDLILTSILSI